MDVKEKILKLLNKNRGSKGVDLAKKLNLTPQTISYHLSHLQDQKLIHKKGSTRAASFYLGANQSKDESAVLNRKLLGLEEDRVFHEIDLKLQLKKKLSDSAYQIFQYAFTEMLNNAIDHSNSNNVEITVDCSGRNSEFQILDHGIGIIPKAQTSFKIKEPLAALEHVCKGKQTSDPKRHSGQGIFFTSRAADTFSIKSLQYCLTFDNKAEDQFLKEESKIKGTKIDFSISKKSRKSLQEIFGEYTNDDLEFHKNRVRIKLSKMIGLLSRSQAKRLLIGLDKYQEIEFDFKNVDGIGQAFADEIFRVWASKFTNKSLVYTNANSAVAFMIEKARKS